MRVVVVAGVVLVVVLGTVDDFFAVCFVRVGRSSAVIGRPSKDDNN